MAYTLGWVATDWSIDSGTGAIRYIGDAHGGTSPSYVTVIDFHRALQDFADNATAAGDDLLDISSETPSDRSTDNIITMLNSFNIDDLTSEHLYDGSIIQASGDTIYDGVVNFGNAKYITLIQDGTKLNNTVDFMNSYSADGTAGFLFPPNNTQAGISHNFLVKVRDGGVDIDGRRLVGMTREENKTNAEFSILGTARGNNVLALSDSDDLNNQTAWATIATWDKFANDSEGYDNSQNVDNLGGNEEYYSRWDIDTGTLPDEAKINDLYEYMKWSISRGTTEILYGLDGDMFRGITHEITYSAPTGTFDESNPVTFAGGATAQVLADNGTDTMWVQILTGAESDISGGITQTTPDAASATTGVVTARPVNVNVIGQSTGSAIIGAYGFGIDASDLGSSDSLTDLTAATITPPNNVTFSVKGLESGDRVLVTPESIGAINRTQMTLASALNGATVTTVNVGAGNIPTDIEATGTVRVVNDDGFDVLLTYTAYDNVTGDITVDSYDFSGTNENAAATLGNGVYFTYIDKDTATTEESFTVVYAAGIPLFIRVRDAGGTPMKTFETTATFGDGNSSVSVIRTADS